MPQHDLLTDDQPIPSKKFFTISEVSQLCRVENHTLRYWEDKFPGLQNVERRNKRRWYRREHIVLVREIRRLVHDQGYTIEGAQQKLSNEPDRELSASARGELRTAIAELEQLLSELSDGDLS